MLPCHKFFILLGAVVAFSASTCTADLATHARFLKADAAGSDHHGLRLRTLPEPGPSQRRGVAWIIQKLLLRYREAHKAPHVHAQLAADDFRRRSPCEDEQCKGSDSVLPDIIKGTCATSFVPRAPLLPGDGFLLAHHFPLILLSAITIHEHPRTRPNVAVMAFGMAPNVLPSVGSLYAYAFDIDYNEGQTFRVHDILDFSYLPHACHDVEKFLPVLTLIPSQNKVAFYSFGLHKDCSQVAIYDPSARKLQPVNSSSVSDGSVPPNLFMSMVAVQLHPNDGVESLLLFGGMHCHTEPVNMCKNYSNLLYIFRFVDERMTSGSWSVYDVAGPHKQSMPSARISTSMFVGPNSTLLMYGGSSQPMTFTSAGLRHSMQLRPECDLWQFDLKQRNWMLLATMDEDCANRAAAKCALGYPMQAHAAYSSISHSINIASVSFRPIFGKGILKDVPCISVRAVLWTWNLTAQKEPWREIKLLQRIFITNTGRRLAARSVFNTVLLTAKGRIFLVDSYRLSIQEAVASSKEASCCSNCTEGTLRVLDAYRPTASFPGNMGCLSTPVTVKARPFEASLLGHSETVMFLGGFCVVNDRSSSRSGDIRLPSWSSLPIWTFNVRWFGLGSYIMRIVQPSPPFLFRVLPSVTVVQDRDDTQWAILYGGVSLFNEKITDTVWCFNTQHYYWLNSSASVNQTTPSDSRYAFGGHATFTLLHSKTPAIVIYGGAVPALDCVRNDVFMFQFSNLSSCQGRWRNISSRVQGRPLPKLVGHKATVFQDKVFIYGGWNLSSFLWDLPSMLFTITVSLHPSVTVSWQPVKIHHLVPRMGFSTLTPYSNDMLLLLGGTNVTCLLHSSNCSCCATSHLLQLHAGNGSQAGHLQAKAIPFFRHEAVILHSTVGTRVFGGLPFKMMRTRSGDAIDFQAKICHLKMAEHNCPPGMGYSNTACRTCERNTYSSSGVGACKPCPASTMSKSGSWICQNPCTFRDNLDFCNGRGNCSFDRVTNKTKCTCTIYGYMEFDNCHLPMKQIIFTASGLAGLLICAVVLKVVQSVRRSRQRALQRERDLQVSRWQLQELSNGVLISWNDLKFSKKLGEGAAGQVHLASLEDTQYAVKTLRQCRLTDLPFLEQFSKEIENMRTVRHSNIVMFIGAGTQPQTNMPFIVMEYIAHGSLFKLLRDTSFSITHGDRLRFALGAARGMKYLHGMTTPRLHCDLKSSNLLVTSAGNVKIGDFGMLRLVSTLRDVGRTPPEERLMANYAVCRRLQSRTVSASTQNLLADTSSDSSQCEEYIGPNLTQVMGTSRWCAPETLHDNIFTKQTDVFSYGVVLWEILTRELPYNNLENEDQVVREIKDGWRLPVPAASPETYEYRKLMESCWEATAAERPLFKGIVSVLEQQTEDYHNASLVHVQ